MRRDLSKPHLIVSQEDSPSVPVNGATSVKVSGRAFSKLSPSARVRRTLMGLFGDGSVRRIVSLDWPAQSTVTVMGETAAEVWIHTNASEPVSIGEEIETS